MSLALLILLAAVAIVASGLALALLARHDADVVIEHHGYPGDEP